MITNPTNDQEVPMRLKRPGSRWIPVVSGVAIIMMSLLLFAGLVHWMYGTFSLVAVREFIASIGWGGVPVYIVFFIVGSFLFASATALSVIAPALFGPWVGFVAILVGNMAAAASMFALTRRAGDRWRFFFRIQQRIPEGLIRFAQGNGLRLVFFARLLMLPASLVNYTAAFLPISFYEFLLGTFLGTVSHCLSTALSIGLIRDAFIVGRWSSLMRWETALLAATYAATFIAMLQIKAHMGHGDRADALLRNG
jgi:uncharacterized membrane protein YdjX (TVP38/TMEM64 family)